MKILVLTFVLLAAFEQASAQSAATTVSPVALRVSAEALQMFNSFKAKALKEIKSFESDIQTRVSQYYNELTRIKSQIESKLNKLGSKGSEILSAINDDIDLQIDSLKTQFDSETLETEINWILGSLKSQFIDPLPNNIEWWKNAVNINKKAAKCWDNNKAGVKSLVDNIFQDMQTVIKNDRAEWNAQIKALVKQIREAVDKIEKEVQVKCKSNQACTLLYVS